MQRELLSITNANVGNNYFCDLCLVITLRAAVERSRSVCTQQELRGRQSGSAFTGTATERQRRKGAVVKSTVPGTLAPRQECHYSSPGMTTPILPHQV